MASTTVNSPLAALKALGDKTHQVKQTLAQLEAERVVPRLWEGDKTLWQETSSGQEITLGWLRTVEEMRPHVDELQRFGGDLTEPGFSHVVLLGMAGSSLCAEVLRRINTPMAGHPALIVLDSTLPAAVRRVEGMIDPAHTLFLVATKSGMSVEPKALYSYFLEVVGRSKGPNAGENFVAVTDEGSVLEAEANQNTFRRIFLNPGDIADGYSALSFFGLVPAAVMGLDVAAMLDRAEEAVRGCAADLPIARNPGAVLGAALGTLARAGRNKLTLITPPPLAALGLWVEQIVAESTGKHGRGIVPVVGEPLANPDVYGQDRVFVQVRLHDSPGLEENPLLRALSEAGHPIIDLALHDPMDVSAEFFRWEFAMAVAAKVLEVHPFELPDMRESVDCTRALLQEFHERGTLPRLERIAEFERLTLLAEHADSRTTGRDEFVHALRSRFTSVRPGDYFALMAYCDETEDRDALLQLIRVQVRDALKVATTVGYGPRLLHATGQLHRGGPDNGLFLQLTADDGGDMPIPGQSFGFATLAEAQAMGDFQSLAARGRRIVRIHLGTDVDLGLRALPSLIADAIRRE